MVKKWSVSYPAVNGVEQRRVYVYLPTMYEADPERRYPVLYMFDGQNVFFDADATYGKSWGKDTDGRICRHEGALFKRMSAGRSVLPV